MITCIYLFRAIWLCRTFLLGRETLKTTFFSSFFCDKNFFLMDEFDCLVLKPENFFKIIIIYCNLQISERPLAF